MSATFRHGLNLTDLRSLSLASEPHWDATWLFKLASIRHLGDPLGPASMPPSATSTPRGPPDWPPSATWPQPCPSNCTPCTRYYWR